MCQIRVALFTTMLLAIVEISIANTISRQSLQCKNVARDAIMNSCKGERIKRSMENAQLLLHYLRNENVDVSRRPEDLLGFSLSSDELEELLDEVGYRMPRSSKDRSRQIFQSVAMKCCPNPKLCYDNPGIIPCMGY
ncbi:uncharacterized protein LOC117161938 [Bombus vancouverensis nearcticus]|uniref:Uncharacterized protein LOC117210560 n=1 Tax=Bombus bifarius TaxID=103933 RepID=A0A6P8MJT5_9HYME|nr:uncharacterized protein LOC117161938 [Bombus vancouverensis nearcticus]XP_033309584.1 uncharacterized protein LOC117210560 [Bombus bifarius]